MANATPPTPLRDDGLTLLSIWHYGVGGFYLLATAALMVMTLAFGAQAIGSDAALLIPTALFGTIALIFMALTLINLAVGYGLWTVRAWGRTGALVLALIGLLFVPIGTVAGGLTLWYLLRPEVTARFSAFPNA